jgi:SAM-dependent methyltransferase
MRREALSTFACPDCGGNLKLASQGADGAANGDVVEGRLECDACANAFPIVRGLPRFVPSESYATSFGFQWNRFDNLQVDSVMHNDLSRDRFYATTGWREPLKGQRVLEAGCGTGRFTELALETGAEVFSFDLSSAVEASLRNNGSSPGLNLFQASIYKIPLRRGVFDKIFCMGVLQHCPDVRGAFRSLVPFLKPGGEIVIDVYEKPAGFPPLKYIARPFLLPLGTKGIYQLLRWTIPPAFDVKKAIHKIPGIGPQLGRLIPIGPISHAPRLNYTDDELKEVKILSALDMLSPVYDQPQTIDEVRKWFDEAGLDEVEIKRGYNGIDGKGKRPN